MNMSLTNDELLNKVVEILDKKSLNDIQIRNAWTSDANSIKSTKLRTIRMMRVSGDIRLRVMRTAKIASEKQSSGKAKPENVALWGYSPEWLRVDGWTGSSGWREVDEYWEECTICEGEGRKICPACCGRGSF
jgi:hypothetical protein